MSFTVSILSALSSDDLGHFDDTMLLLRLFKAFIIKYKALPFLGALSTTLFVLVFLCIRLYSSEKTFLTAEISVATDSSQNKLQCNFLAASVAFERGTSR